MKSIANVIICLVGTAKDSMFRCNTSSVVQIVVQIATALEYMHCKNFIHCDIKPGNVFIRPNNVAVLGDLGSCLFLEVTKIVMFMKIYWLLYP